MIKILTFLLLLLSYPTLASVDQLRELYWRATDDFAIKFFYQRATMETGKDAVTLAYLGVATAMQAQVTSSIPDKIKYFNDGKSKIEEAVSKDPTNMEVRFLRFSIQSEVPAILGYNNQVDEDFNLILKNLQGGQFVPSRTFCIRMKNFMLNSDAIKNDQKKQLQNISIS